MNVHPITLEVVRNAFVAYSEEMATALCRSAYNMMIYEVRDFCCGLIDTEGRLISQNSGGLPIFLADLGVAVLDGIERYGLDGFEPGDVIIYCPGSGMALKEADILVERGDGSVCSLKDLQLREIDELLERHRDLWRFYVLISARAAQRRDDVARACTSRFGPIAFAFQGVSFESHIANPS